MWTWSKTSDPSSAGFLGITFMVSMIVGLILAIATSFKPKWSPITAPLYAACEGLLLGILSAYFEMRYPGIVMQAVGLTFAVTFAMLMGYKAGWLQATPGLRKGLMIAMGGIDDILCGCLDRLYVRHSSAGIYQWRRTAGHCV